MKIRSLKVIVEANDIRKVFDLKNGISFDVPSEQYEEYKCYIVYGEGEIGLIPTGGRYFVADKMQKDLDPKVFAPDVQVGLQ